MATKGEPVSYVAEAERILNSVGDSVKTGRDSEDIASALLGVGYALLAIQEELRLNREGPPLRVTT